jgi:hypothetical protein
MRMRFEPRDEASDSSLGTKLAVALKCHSTGKVDRFEQVIVCVTELVIKSRQLKAHDAGLREQLKSTLTLK